MKKKLYAVRGIGCYQSDVWIGPHFKYTILTQIGELDWHVKAEYPRHQQVDMEWYDHVEICYNGFTKVFGPLDQGHYCIIEGERVDG
jgi:hypothetical protein